jgi:hypothetical protein
MSDVRVRLSDGAITPPRCGRALGSRGGASVHVRITRALYVEGYTTVRIRYMRRAAIRPDVWPRSSPNYRMPRAAGAAGRSHRVTEWSSNVVLPCL